MLFLSELGRDTANIDDRRIAGEKLAVVYSNDIEEHAVGSELLQFSNFKLCVDKKTGRWGSRNIYASPNSGNKPNIAFSKHSHSAYIPLFNELKQQWWKVIFETETDKWVTKSQ